MREPVDPGLRKVYRGFGIELPDHNGDDSWTLPLPARIVVGGDGVVQSIDADPDDTLRPEPTGTVETLRSLATSPETTSPQSVG